MKYILPFFIISYIFSTPVFSQEKDSLFIKDQLPVAGKLERIRYGQLRFDMENVGVIDVDLIDIVTFKTTGFGYRIQTAKREFLIGNFVAHEEAGRVKIYDGTDEFDITITNLNEVNRLRENFFDRIDGRFGAGFTLSRTENRGIYNGDLEVRFDTERLEMDLDGSIIYSQASEGLSRDRENLQLSANYFLSSNWQTVGLVNYQRILQLGIARRLQVGGGVGKFFIREQRAIGRVVSGLVINQEFTVEGFRSDYLFEVPLILDFNIFSFSKPQINFRTTQSLFTGLTQWGRIRNDGNNRLRWTVIRDVDIGLNFYYNFDNRSPVEDGTNFDYGIVFEIGIQF